MSLWFTGTAVLPELSLLWGSGISVTSWLTIAVQLGFVAGALVISVFNLSDIFRPTRVFVVCALAAAAANAGFALAAGQRHIFTSIALRVVTGAFLAGTYPTGMKILAGWFREGRGLALGVMVGALAVGSAAPHGVLAIGAHVGSANLGAAWRTSVLAASGFAVIGAAIVALGVREGPYSAPSPPFSARQVGEALRNRRLRLANFGYLGHMWELYSMWTWIAVLLAAASPAASKARVELVAFATIASALVGCVWAGWASDRLSRPRGVAGEAAGAGDASVARVPNETAITQDVAGRARVTIYAMGVSGVCCLLAALVFNNF